MDDMQFNFGSQTRARRPEDRRRSATENVRKNKPRLAGVPPFLSQKRERGFTTPQRLCDRPVTKIIIENASHFAI